MEKTIGPIIVACPNCNFRFRQHDAVVCGRRPQLEIRIQTTIDVTEVATALVMKNFGCANDVYELMSTEKKQQKQHKQQTSKISILSYNSIRYVKMNCRLYNTRAR